MAIRPLRMAWGTYRGDHTAADIDLAVAEGFEPSGELPPHALSRRVPSAARAGHRNESNGRFHTARAQGESLRRSDRGVPRTRAGRPVAGDTRRGRTSRCGID